MKKQISLFIAAVVLSGSAFAHSICEPENLRHITTKDAQFRSLDELFSKSASEGNFHIFGEMHYHTDQKLLAKIIQGLFPKLPGPKKCLFLELPAGGLKYIDEKFEEILKSDKVTPEQRANFKIYLNYYPSMVRVAKEIGVAVWEVDHPDHFKDDKSEDERNLAMSQKAQELLSNGSCSSAIMFVGKAHISPLENRISLPELLRRAGLRPITYMTEGESAEYPEVISWRGLSCTPKNIGIAAFSNDGLLPGTKLFPKGKFERWALWNDFDYSILEH